MPRLLLVLQVYLGRLRESEVERITERFHHGIVEICLTLTVFRQDFDARLVILMGVLAMVKVFHWLIQDRINYIQTESSITPLQHLRIVSFLSILTVRFLSRGMCSRWLVEGVSSAVHEGSSTPSFPSNTAVYRLALRCNSLVYYPNAP